MKAMNENDFETVCGWLGELERQADRLLYVESMFEPGSHLRDIIQSVRENSSELSKLVCGRLMNPTGGK